MSDIAERLVQMYDRALIKAQSAEIERLQAEVARLHDRYWMLEKSTRDDGGKGIPSHLR